MKTLVKISFNKIKHRWDMFIGRYFIMDFPPCRNFSRLFDLPDCTKDETYVVEIHRFNKKPITVNVVFCVVTVLIVLSSLLFFASKKETVQLMAISTISE